MDKKADASLMFIVLQITSFSFILEHVVYYPYSGNKKHHERLQWAGGCGQDTGLSLFGMNQKDYWDWGKYAVTVCVLSCLVMSDSL